MNIEPTHSIGDEFEIRIERIVPRGLGLGHSGGLTVFVPLAAVGDKLNVRIYEIKGRSAFAEIIEILEPSSDRIDPICEYFGECGGCDLMQLGYAAQLAAKRAMILDCFRRIAKLDQDIEIKMIGSPAQLGYRLRAQWHAEPAAGKIGYYRRNSRSLVNVEKCAVLLPELQAELERQRRTLDPAIDGKTQIDAAVGSEGLVSTYSNTENKTAKEIYFEFGGERLSFSARTFFQGNRWLIDRLVEEALADASGDLAFDLYSGVGLFTLPLARRFSRVVAVEDNPVAVEFAAKNASLAGLNNIEQRRESVRKFLGSREMPPPEFVLLDPPRSGTERDTIMNLIELAPQRVSFVACEPSILARDLRRFIGSGYSISGVVALDLFPQTHHVETIAHLERNG
ncbi:class I SAM-dependent RNA methyltransferase [Leptolyngbya sp. 7M]|uniref:class I SAM-dependent RNA methyltransferase n=1 Tax=Leptolyngbya sp. 7M TaxID=2812896 RepID=UPI001B8CB306|nr:TRAM domain-containing protein [Leptolyngbya sp. 7M]QYO65509.1 TRAM domain-containing protein [Leptolyngbya sp. 7M]